MKRIYHTAALISIGCAVFTAHGATSRWANITVAGEFNSWNNTTNPLTLISNNLWSGTIVINRPGGTEFLFTIGNWDLSWKESGQSWFGPDLSGTLHSNVGDNIQLHGAVTGAWTFTFNDVTMDYEVRPARTNAMPWTSAYPYVSVAATFNGYDTYATNMMLVSNGVWQGYFVIENQTDPQFLFATKDFTTTWKENDQTVFTLPMAAQSELNSGSDMVIAGAVNGTFRFTLDERTGRYEVEDVTAVDASSSAPWINEIHYDHVGTDTNEYFEIAGPAGLNLTNYTVYLYNGSGGAVYGTNTLLSGTIPNEGGSGFGAVVFRYPTQNSLQNGSPDGIALAENSSGKLVEFLSYEGAMTGVGGPADGVVSTDIGVEESNTTPVDFSLQRVGTATLASAFTWIGPQLGSPGSLNDGQTPIAGVPPATLSISSVALDPSSPGAMEPVHVQASISGAGASNIQATVFFRTSSNSLFNAQPMILTDGVYRTVSPLPGLPVGSSVEYYLFANFRGRGTNSPIYYPANAPESVLRYGVSATPAGRVWINEVEPRYDGFIFDPSWSFIELAGWAGSDISGWQVRLYDLNANPWTSYTLPAGSVLTAQNGGFGFYILASEDFPGESDLQLTEKSGGVELTEPGGVELLNEFGVRQHSIWYSDSTNPPAPQGFTDLRYSDNSVNNPDQTLGLIGTGGVASAFIWKTNASASAGAANNNQMLEGGNTNPLAPIIFITTNQSVFFTCPTDPLPPVDLGIVTARSLCAGTVTVSFVTAVTNNGTGCGNSPRIITRTFQAVSECGTTSTCDQVFTWQDNIPPSVVLKTGTQTLFNAGFEAGSLVGWTSFGTLSNRFSANLIRPHTDYVAGRYGDPVSSFASDESEFGNDGLIYGAPNRGQSGADAKETFSMGFDGISDRIDIPFSSTLNNTQFSFSVWVRAEGPTGVVGTVLSSKNPATPAGYVLYRSSSNRWEFWTGHEGGWSNLVGSVAVSSGTWTHIAGTYNAANGQKILYVNGASVGSITSRGFRPNPNENYPIRLAADSSLVGAESYFKGSLDAVQLYGRVLTPAQVATLNSSALNVATGVVAHLLLNETGFTKSVTSGGIYQSLPATAGQRWSASGFLLNPGDAPIQKANQAAVELQFFNAATGLLQAVTSQPLTALSAVDTYSRYEASAVAPANTAWARLVLRYTRNSDAGGVFHADDMQLSRFSFDAGTNCSFALPDFRDEFNVTDNCSVTQTNQSPAPGTLLSPGSYNVVVSAKDACDQTGSATIAVTISDSTPPVIVASNITIGCESMLTPTTGVSVIDCSPVDFFVLGQSSDFGSGCPGSPRTITRILQGTDAFGYTTLATQTITQVMTNGPVISCSPSATLLNADFENIDGLAGWARSGSAASSVVTSRPGGTHSVKMGSPSSASIYQDMPAQAGQHWRGSAWVLQRSGIPIGSGRLELRLFFIDGSGVTLQTLLSRSFTRTDPTNVFVSLYVQGVAPTGTRSVRIAPSYIQVTGAAEVYVDDVSLDMTTFTATNETFALPDLAAMIAVDETCSELQIAQVPAPGTTLNLGTTPVEITAVNQCGMTSVCTTVVTVLDESGEDPLPPEPTNVEVVGMSMTATGMTVRSLGTNTWSVHAEYTTNLMGNPQNWIVVPTSSNSFLNGTNITTFQPPVTGNTPVIYRIWQKYP